MANPTADGHHLHKRTPISRPLSRAKQNRRNPIALKVFNNARHLPSCRPLPHPFSLLVGCEMNRTRHPSGSSLPRCSATALVAFATPEKRWYQAMSNGLLAFVMVAALTTTPVLMWLMAWAIHQSAFIPMAQRRRPNHQLWLYTSPLAWLAALGQTLTRNIDLHRRAFAPAACGSTLAPACAPGP